MAVEPDELVSAGLAAMCGVADETFNDKHWGAAVITAGLLAGRSTPATRAAIIRQAEALMAARRQWFPPPVRSAASDPAPIVEALAESAGELHLLGHDTIFASLALRAMHEQPALATAANVSATVRLIGAASGRGPGGPFPGWVDPAAVRAIGRIDSIDGLVESALLGFARAAPVGDGRDRGVVQHLLTHARSLVDLHDLGHVAEARVGFDAHLAYRTLMERRPTSVNDPLPADAAPPQFDRAAYWDALGHGHDWLFGHVFKVAYAWRALADRAPADVVRDAEPMLATCMVIT